MSKNVKYLLEFKNTLLLKNANHHMSLQGTLIFLLVGGLASVPMVAH